MGRVTCTEVFAALDVRTCSGKAITRPVPAVAVPEGTSTATKPVTCVVGELMVLTTTPELEPTETLLDEALLDDEALLEDETLLAGATVALAVNSGKVGGAELLLETEGASGGSTATA